MDFLLGIILVFLIFVIPVVIFGPVLEKAGFPILWSLLLVIPIVNLIAIWVFSFISWPAEGHRMR